MANVKTKVTLYRIVRCMLILLGLVLAGVSGGASLFLAPSTPVWRVLVVAAVAGVVGTAAGGVVQQSWEARGKRNRQRYDAHLQAVRVDLGTLKGSYVTDWGNARYIDPSYESSAIVSAAGAKTNALLATAPPPGRRNTGVPISAINTMELTLSHLRTSVPDLMPLVALALDLQAARRAFDERFEHRLLELLGKALGGDPAEARVVWGSNLFFPRDGHPAHFMVGANALSLYCFSKGTSHIDRPRFHPSEGHEGWRVSLGNSGMWFLAGYPPDPNPEALERKVADSAAALTKDPELVRMYGEAVDLQERAWSAMQRLRLGVAEGRSEPEGMCDLCDGIRMMAPDAG